MTGSSGWTLAWRDISRPPRPAASLLRDWFRIDRPGSPGGGRRRSMRQWIIFNFIRILAFSGPSPEPFRRGRSATVRPSPRMVQKNVVIVWAIKSIFKLNILASHGYLIHRSSIFNHKYKYCSRHALIKTPVDQPPQTWTTTRGGGRGPLSRHQTRHATSLLQQFHHPLVSKRVAALHNMQPPVVKRRTTLENRIER